MPSDRQFDRALDALRFTLGATAFAAGADKFTNLLTDWEQYLSPLVSRSVPMSPKNFMRLAGVVEMAVGALILRGNTRLGGYIASAWLLAISANLVASGKYFDIAARDVNMAVAAFALGHLSEGRSSRSSHRTEQEAEQLHRAA